MAIRRQKIDRKANLKLDGNRVIDMPPGWAFSVDCQHHGKIDFDFAPFRANGREDLAAHFRDAVWGMRHESVGLTIHSRKLSIRTFWRFLDDLEAAGEKITGLNQIDRKKLDRFLTWLELQTASMGKNKGERLSIATRKQLFSSLKAILINRQKRAPDAISPDLAFPRNPFPNSNRLTPKRQAYTDAEQKRITHALNADLRQIHEHGGEEISPLQVLAVHLLIFGLATGRNMQSLLELRRDSLREHPLKDRELLVTIKRRGWSTHATSVRKSASAPENDPQIENIPASIGDHFRFLCTYTEPLAAEAQPRDRDIVFLRRGAKGGIDRFDYRDATNAIRSFINRHGLLDDRGRPLRLNMSQLRPTFASALYRRTGDIRRVQQALGHANVQTTARHYVDAPIEAERDHAFVLDSMVGQFTRYDVDGKVLIAADGKIPLQNVKNLLSSGYSSGIARCQNPFRDEESVCKKFFACFKCPSMCVFEDDLWRLFSFYYRLLVERRKIHPAHWEKTYGPIIRRIDTDIASQFPADKVAEARKKAQENPHPAWRGVLL